MRSSSLADAVHDGTAAAGAVRSLFGRGGLFARFLGGGFPFGSTELFSLGFGGLPSHPGALGEEFAPGFASSPLRKN
jgi:hypothetical protein